MTKDQSRLKRSKASQLGVELGPLSLSSCSQPYLSQGKEKIGLGPSSSSDQFHLIPSFLCVKTILVQAFVHSFNASMVIELLGPLRGFPDGLVCKESACQIQETQVLSLGYKDFLEKEMATHSSILAWEIPFSEESMGLQELGMT